MSHRRITARAAALAGVLALGQISFSALAADPSRRVVIEYEDTAGGQALSSSAFVAHAHGVHLWELGKPASLPVREMAEEGSPEWVLGSAVFSDGKEYGDVAVAPPIGPHGHRRVEITVTPAHPEVSGLFMLGQTNDGFAGIDAVEAYHLAGPKTVEAFALDAGTSKNLEDKAHLRVFGSFGREPENGVVALHPGIHVGGDVPAEWAFDPKQPVAQFTITPAGTVGE